MALELKSLIKEHWLSRTDLKLIWVGETAQRGSDGGAVCCGIESDCVGVRVAERGNRLHAPRMRLLMENTR